MNIARNQKLENEGTLLGRGGGLKGDEKSRSLDEIMLIELKVLDYRTQ